MFFNAKIFLKNLTPKEKNYNPRIGVKVTYSDGSGLLNEASWPSFPWKAFPLTRPWNRWKWNLDRRNYFLWTVRKTHLLSKMGITFLLKSGVVGDVWCTYKVFVEVESLYMVDKRQACRWAISSMYLDASSPMLDRRSPLMSEMTKISFH